mmetsp:Transcript_12907/g.31391  ORF Transcript_12907/g.31391 Transcript_12907/m.31391 type:complete len:293 (-) Transcript_12907:873-1751(-)
MTIETKEVIKDCSWEIRNLLSSDECQDLRDEGSKNEIELNHATGDRRHRNNCRQLLHDPVLAELLWTRLQSLVPSEYVIGGPDGDESMSLPPGFNYRSGLRRECQGTWNPSGVNENFTLLYYHSGGHFGPHRDSHVVVSDHERSMLTLTVYLVDRPTNHGGATSFLRDDMDIPPVDKNGRLRSPKEFVIAKVHSDEAGKALIFTHDLLHEGEPLEVQKEDGTIDESTTAAPKWLLVGQILYKRDKKSAPELTPQQLEARELLRQAEEAEVQQEISKAIKLYSKAYKLDPSLE